MIGSSSIMSPAITAGRMLSPVLLSHHIKDRQVEALSLFRGYQAITAIATL